MAEAEAAAHLPAPGRPVDPQEVRLSRARAVIDLLREVAPPFVRLLECRRLDGPPAGDVVVVEVEVERGQRPVNDICRQERIALILWDDDGTIPETLALRTDFPAVPHLNLRAAEFPRSLCLTDEPWRDWKRRWTARDHIERVRAWLAHTADGALHAPDQPLEPLLLGSPVPLVLPAGLLDEARADRPETVTIHAVGGAGRLVLVADRVADDRRQPVGKRYVATVIQGAPQTHGVIRRAPTYLDLL